MSLSSGWLSRLRTKFSGAAGDDSPLLEFAPETPDPPVTPKPERRFARTLLLSAGLAIVAFGAVAATGIVRRPEIDTLFTASRSAGAASLTIRSEPGGAQVMIDGVARGATPLALQIPAGSHQVTVQSGAQQRAFTIEASAGADMVRDLEFAAAAPATGTVAVVTEPAGAMVTVDGAEVGAAPVAVELPPGTHHVSVSSAAGISEREIILMEGQNASVVFSLGRPAVRATGLLAVRETGWLQISAPFQVQLIEDGEVIGDGASRVPLPPGRHDVVIINASLAYRELRSVSVGPGQTVAVRVDPPSVALNINARPWAEVTLDGVSLGQTPIAQAMVPIGARRLVFRHPELGEREHNLVVTTKPGQRIAVDLTK